MQDNKDEVIPNNELKDFVDFIGKGCCGGGCSTPNPEPSKCEGPCVQCKTTECSCPKKANIPTETPSPLIFVPEGLEVNLDVGTSDLSKKIQELFAANKKRLEENPSGGQINDADFAAGDYVDVLLPNGMSVKVHKDSHKAKDADMSRLLDAAGGEMDCSEEDDEGNKIIHETELAADGTDKAKTDYKPGMLRDLKAKYYPTDTTGQEAQARLENREQAAEDVAERFRQENEKYTKPTTCFDGSQVSYTFNRSQLSRHSPDRMDGKTLWNNLDKWAESIEKGDIIDGDTTVTVKLESGVEIHVPKDFDFCKGCGDKSHTVVDDPVEAKAKLERIFHAATVPAKNEAGEARAERTKELVTRVYAERAVAAAKEREAFYRKLSEKERIARLTRDTITISPIENPNIIRRAIRQTRRTWKKLLTWWRL